MVSPNCRKRVLQNEANNSFIMCGMFRFTRSCSPTRNQRLHLDDSRQLARDLRTEAFPVCFSGSTKSSDTRPNLL